MSPRSLQASQEGIKLARRALTVGHWTQESLASQVGKTRQPISKFLKGEPIDRRIFLEICTALDLNWEDIVEQKAEVLSDDRSLSVDALVQQIRAAIAPTVRQRCGTIRVLDMVQPIELTGDDGIYTNVNILERLTGHQRLEVAELLRMCDIEEFDRAGLSRITEERVPGLGAVQRYNKLLALGKPGAGKTTFLKWLAMQSIKGLELGDKVPFFITLKDFAEAKDKPDVLSYLHQDVTRSLASANSNHQELLTRMKAAEPDASPLQEILSAGKALILLDGLDEVREEDTKRVLRQIREFSEQFHGNQFVMTCRIAAKDYTFEQFTEVEVSDFSSEQIADFVEKWFRRTNPQKAEKFLQKLEQNKPIQELASSPLLLTLLCLMFSETADFPSNRSELYKEGLDVLLKKWDGKRNIERQQVYKNLSVQRKEDLLSSIALTTFEQRDYFFKQKTVEAYIADFIRNLHNQDPDPEMLTLDSESVLKSIEAHHGLLVERAKNIYSFSHLTFHEYFTAREIVANSAYERLVKHITEKRWREVFLLTAGMMRTTDALVQLMKQIIDRLITNDQTLQRYLIWVTEKSQSVETSYKPAAVRAFYFAAARDYALALALDRDLDRALALNRDLNLDRALHRALDSDLAHAHALALAEEPELRNKLQELYERLPDTGYKNRKSFDRWREANGETWREELRAVMIEHRNIGHDWQFSNAQKYLLQQYYDANKLLVDCLNSDCYVSREVRQEIEDTLLLPIEEIRKRGDVKE
ncbi:NACHT domain-containing NTPase [Leptolyngbya sp. FACHB-36]|uniref:NACHT domain-containing protein n=1 Tax=Leptolyngbya sp. FACHB-36 TaxID=2692808 RepID=UPI001681028E|nr:NACHT domain-containing NTPase [Leptolyngbya sp. FACHB-36]MBD2018724.1 NACHT domain-containing NTPase [Leptolyngbya sp. FACHB-36]